MGGFAKDGEMNTGPWSLTLVEQHLGEQAVSGGTGSRNDIGRGR